MDEETRQRAEEKRGTLINKIGYPDKWRDYSALEVSADSHFANMVKAIAFESNFQLGNHALLQSFLVGQPELRRLLESSKMEQLRQRVIASPTKQG